MAVARAGEEATPVEPAPVALRPFLQFARLPAPALGVARRVLESDEPFRARVAGVVTEEQVGRAGWLFLTRPHGWQDDLDDMARRAEDSRAEAADRRAETTARRRLAAVEAAARRAEETAAAARAEAARADDALAEERRARREAARREAELAERADQLAARVGELTARVEALGSERDEAKEVASAAVTEAARAGARADRLRAQLDAARAAPSVAGEGPSSAEAVPSTPLDRSAPPASSGARDALASAARAASALADALAAAADAVGDGSTATAADGPPSEPTAPATDPPPPRVGAARRRPALPRRAPAPLPPGILEDSTEAAEHLVRLRGVVLLVDGYNVSHAAWPGTPISEQRRRLVDALGELAARTGADVRVVFDGSDTVDPPPVASTPRAVRVRFSPAEVEADDVIVDEVAALPPTRPVVVVSSDRRVRDESRANGANVLRSSQLLGLLHLR